MSYTLFNSPTIFNLPNFGHAFSKSDILNKSDSIDTIPSILGGIKYNKINAIKIVDFVDSSIKLDLKGWTFAFYAVAFNNFIILEYLICDLKFNINIVDNYGNSLLMVAIIYGNFDIANYLISYNINLNIYNYEGHTAYTYALMNNQQGLMYILRKTAESRMPLESLKSPPGL